MAELSFENLSEFPQKFAELQDAEQKNFTTVVFHPLILKAFSILFPRYYKKIVERDKKIFLSMSLLPLSLTAKVKMPRIRVG